MDLNIKKTSDDKIQMWQQNEKGPFGHVVLLQIK